MLKFSRYNIKKRKLFLAMIFCMVLCVFSFAKSQVEASAIVTYKMQKEIVSFKEGDIARGIVYFQYPKLEGNTIQISKINKVLKNAMKAYMADQSAESLKEYTLASIKNKSFMDDKEQYYWKTNCKITYNTNNIISMHMKEMWYAGGVYNQKDYGYTFNLKTGKVLTAVDVIGSTSKQVKTKVLSSAKKYFKKYYKNSYDVVWNDVSNVINSYDAKDFKFYLTPGKARVCFESYELNCGTGYQVISVTSKYK